MRILVTGATGFLGTNLVEKLIAAGHRVTPLGSKDADLTVEGTLRKYSETYDRIYHLAAWTQAGDFCLKNPGAQWLNNQKMNTEVLAWWHERQPQAKLICMGTSCAYPEEGKLVEERYFDGKPTESLFSYAMTKRMLLAGLQALGKQFGHRWAYFIPCTLYGPGYHTDDRQLHFIFDLMRKILIAQKGGVPAVLWGDGHQKRELVFLEDFSRNLLDLSDTVENDWINLGTGEEYSIREFAGMICDLIGYDPAKVQYDTSKYVGARSKVLDVGKLDRLLPNRLKTSLKEGLEITLKWIKKHTLIRI